MKPADKKPLVLGFPDYLDEAHRFADSADMDFATIDIHHFPDGESLVRLPEALPGDVLLFTSLDRPNARLVELELAAGAAYDLGATRLTLVAPYLCYMRQDIAFHPGEAVSQRIIGALLARRFDTLVTVDPHLHRTKSLEAAIPVRHAVTLTAAPAMAAALGERGDLPMLLGPDAESEQWVARIAGMAGLDFGVARKRRAGDRDVHITLPDIDFAGRNVVLVDDVASTGQTLIEAALALGSRGVESISVMVTHALFVGDAIKCLHAAGVTDISSTDSIRHSTNRIPLAGLLASGLDAC
jgi:ribose-phosphate pyrophosphokinase